MTLKDYRPPISQFLAQLRHISECKCFTEDCVRFAVEKCFEIKNPTNQEVLSKLGEVRRKLINISDDEIYDTIQAIEECFSEVEIREN